MASSPNAPSSTSDLEVTLYNDNGIPVGTSGGKQDTQVTRQPVADAPQLPIPPRATPKEWRLAGLSKPFPTVGWVCTSNDVNSVDVQLLDAGGDATTEEAMGRALSAISDAERAQKTVVTAIDAIESACAAAFERLGGKPIDIVSLSWEEADLESVDTEMAAAWQAMMSCVQKGLARSVGLRCSSLDVALKALPAALSCADRETRPLLLQGNLGGLLFMEQVWFVDFWRRRFH
eukprot:gene5043-6144_t